MDSIKLTAQVAGRLAEHHLASAKNTESLSFAYGRLIEDQGQWVVLVAQPGDLVFLADDCFMRRNAGHVSIAADVRAGVYWRAYSLGFDVVVDIHDHFFSDEAHFSSVDDRDDLRTAVWFRDKLGSRLKGRVLHSASMLLAQKDWAARRVVTDEGGNSRFCRVAVDVLGESFRRYGAPVQIASETHSRQSPLISLGNQSTLQSLRVAIIGTGGTGSVAVETAARVGFGEIRLIDGDVIAPSNLNRLQGVAPRDVGRNKAEWGAARGADLFPGTRFKAVPTDVFAVEARDAIAGSDLALVCVDNSETSWYVNRLCMQYLLPYWNVGVLIDAEPRVVLHSRVNAVIPGLTPCGECSDIQFFPRKRPDAFLDTHTLAAQRAAGYVKNTLAENPAAAIYALNQQVVGTMFTEITSWLCGWWPLAHSLYVRSDDPLCQRLDRSQYDNGPASDCAVCSFLMGRASTCDLPRRGETVEVAL